MLAPATGAYRVVGLKGLRSVAQQKGRRKKCRRPLCSVTPRCDKRINATLLTRASPPRNIHVLRF